MKHDPAALYTAFVSGDPRFDGVFYVGVVSTGVYCRPVCAAKKPRQENCRFFRSAEAAEKASFRPCLRCRPDLAPGYAPVDDAHRIASLIPCRIQDMSSDDASAVESIAAQFELSSRQIRRIVQKEFGVSPTELIRTRRLLLAKQLLTETALPITQVAYASGFSSLRRFNDAFSRHYRMPPSRLRKEAAGAASDAVPLDTLTLQLAYRPPFDWDGLMQFMHARELKDVETVVDGEYFRTLRLGEHIGWIHVRHAPEPRTVRVRFSPCLVPVLPALLGRVRHAFDLTARPDVIAEQFMQDGLLAGAVARNPGLRVPGAFDGFELAVRAVLGQQITVRAATTLGSRFVEAFGEKIDTPHPGLARLFPEPKQVAALQVEDLAQIGIIRTRARSIISLAEEVSSGRLRLEAGAHPEIAMKRLTALPGIGMWTASYIAMRALRWPDAFPKEDIALRKHLGGVSAAEAEARSQAWRPWRSYAVLHLWQNPVPVGVTP